MLSCVQDIKLNATARKGIDKDHAPALHRPRAQIRKMLCSVPLRPHM
jgi:hypothetical protein